MTFAFQLGKDSNPGIKRLPTNTYTGTAHTITNLDVGRILSFTNSSSVTVTIPLASTEDLGTGFVCYIVKTGTGDVSIVGEGGVTLNALGDNSVLSTQHELKQLYRTGPDTFILQAFAGGGGGAVTGGDPAPFSGMFVDVVTTNKIARPAEFNTTGFVVSPTGDTIISAWNGPRSFTMSTPWDLTTLTATGASAPSESGVGYDVSVVDNGNKLMYGFASNKIRVRSLSNPWSLAGTETNIGLQDFSGTITFRASCMTEDGTKLFMFNETSFRLVSVDLSTPFNPTSWGNLQQSPVTYNAGSGFYGLQISDNGHWLQWYDNEVNGPSLAYMTAPFDVTTAESALISKYSGLSGSDDGPVFINFSEKINNEYYRGMYQETSGTDELYEIRIYGIDDS